MARRKGFIRIFFGYQLNSRKIITTKPNQGVSRECAEYHSRGSFFGSFLDKQKRTERMNIMGGALFLSLF